MSTSAFGVEHVSKAVGDPSQHVSGMAAGSVLAGGLAVGAHVGAKKLPKAIVAHRGAGILQGLARGNAVEAGKHVRGAVRDVKMLGALKGAKAPLALGSAALGVGALAGRRKQAPPVAVSG